MTKSDKMQLFLKLNNKPINLHSILSSFYKTVTLFNKETFYTDIFGRVIFSEHVERVYLLQY